MKRSLIVGVALLFMALPEPSDAGHKMFTKTIYKVNSLYQFIMVDDDLAENERYILVNTKKDRPQGGIWIDHPDQLLFEYTRLAFTSLAFLEREPADVLFVGLGAGVMPRYFNQKYPQARVDAVEIDPEMFNIAKEYFHFKEGANLKVHLLDGRTFIKRTANKYDMIFLDAYSGEQIPFHLTTVEFLKELKGKLKKGGIIVSNILSQSNNRYFWSMVKTYKMEFQSLFLFQGEDSTNYIFVAVVDEFPMENDRFLSRARKIQVSKGMDFELARLPWEYSSSKFDKTSKVLTDDFAPVNLYKEMEISR